MLGLVGRFAGRAGRRVAVVGKGQGKGRGKGKGNLKPVITVCLLALIPGLASAELNLALLDLEKAVFETTKGAKFIEKLGEDLKPQRDEAERIAKEIRSLQDKYRVDEAVMSDRQKQDMEKRIANLSTDLQAIQQKFQRERQSRMNDFAQDMLPKAREVIDNLIKVEGYDMVMIRNPQDQIFYYVNPRNDITAKVTEKLNEAK